MSYDYADRRRGGSGCLTLLGNLLLMVLGGLLLVALVAMIGVWRTGDRFVSELDNLFNAPQPTPQVDVRSVIVKQIRGASELTTTIFTMQTVSDASRARSIAGFEVGTTRLLFIGWGEVRAGVDLSQIEAENVEVISDTIRVQLPPPRILDAKIDVNRSRVYDYDKGFLGLGPDAPELQSLAEQVALEQIIAAACQNQVLEQANAEAEIAVAQLLSVAGYREVIVESQPPPSDVCPQPSNS